MPDDNPRCQIQVSLCQTQAQLSRPIKGCSVLTHPIPSKTHMLTTQYLRLNEQRNCCVFIGGREEKSETETGGRVEGGAKRDDQIQRETNQDREVIQKESRQGWGERHSDEELSQDKGETRKAWPLPSRVVAEGGSSHLLFLFLTCHFELLPFHHWDSKLWLHFNPCLSHRPHIQSPPIHTVCHHPVTVLTLLVSRLINLKHSSGHHSCLRTVCGSRLPAELGSHSLWPPTPSSPPSWLYRQLRTILAELNGTERRMVLSLKVHRWCYLGWYLSLHLLGGVA